MSAILLGNGLNRCLPSYPSWDSLLMNIGNEFFSPVAGLANPLLKYDVMLCDAYREYGSNNTDFRLRQLLKELNIEDLSPDDTEFLAAILNSDVKTILTTNYDYNLETSLFHASNSSYRDEDLKYCYTYEEVASDKRCIRISDLEIHHIHGELNYPKSICLGITKYVDNLAKTVELLSPDKNQFPLTNLQKPIANEVFTRNGWKATWAELLFNTNIYIVGLGLSESELDLWWLLMTRAQLLTYEDLRDKITNKIYYFKPYSDNGPSDTSSLEALHIKVKSFMVTDNDWRSAYLTIWNEIRRLESRAGNAGVSWKTVSN